MWGGPPCPAAGRPGHAVALCVGGAVCAGSVLGDRQPWVVPASRRVPLPCCSALECLASFVGSQLPGGCVVTCLGSVCTEGVPLLPPRGLGGRERRAPQLRGHLGWQRQAHARPLGLQLGSLALQTRKQFERLGAHRNLCAVNTWTCTRKTTGDSPSTFVPVPQALRRSPRGAWAVSHVPSVAEGQWGSRMTGSPAATSDLPPCSGRLRLRPLQDPSGRVLG